ncbi:sensor domain-containing diguanylate cyclase [Xenophilus arseniciresistens]|uniref:diguanylate cyclase n=1 Tax=Xenophilus arseniciresistens TaxID=1283306 RepID=A0AAE3NEX8_9BURK|nr:sensor domain-containing diguanylate cyclase [Xenophilus arseniciresistens]MDA7418349.1 sensor domain-containing diguanylate cyclase [Xenophilus arseniciresistens]
MDKLLDQISETVAGARTLEELTRPMLEMLESVTGLESTYLTTVDLQRSVQNVLYARNAGELKIPEGLWVPWGDTLCRRALDEGQSFCNDVPERWGDSAAARELGIQTYLSTPVRLADGSLYGTLCAASGTRHTLSPRAQRMLALFATLIAQQVEREQLLQQLIEANGRLRAFATTDPLTQLANRRALQQELGRRLGGDPSGRPLMLAFVDLDGFKAINDVHGHDAGDQFLIALGERLRAVLQAGEVAARIGGDEFVVLGWGPEPQAQQRAEEARHAAEQAFGARVEQATAGDYPLGRGLCLSYAGASVGVVSVAPGTLDAVQTLRAADEAMYQVKRARRALAAAGDQAG